MQRGDGYHVNANSDGKIDVTTSSTNEILSEQHYYPFGLTFGGNLWINDATDVDNRYLYNDDRAIP